MTEEHPSHRRRTTPTTAATVTPIRVADLLAEDTRMPVNVHIIDHPDGRVLVDTGMTELHPLVADMDPRLQPLSEQDVDLASIDLVVSTHLHFDHCGGNHLFAGKPIYVQRCELHDARGADYTIREWVDAPGVEYVEIDGEHELLPGLRLLPAPGHTPGMQVVVIEVDGRTVVVGGDVAISFDELDVPTTEGQRRVRALHPDLVWLAHQDQPWRPTSLESALGSDPDQFAQVWIEAWNARDLEGVLRHYADDVVFTSPTAARVAPDSGGRIQGKDELRVYWTAALAGHPDLRFELIAVYQGVDTIVLNYRDQTGRLVNEVLSFRDGLVAVGHATHHQP